VGTFIVFLTLRYFSNFSNVLKVVSSFSFWFIKKFRGVASGCNW